MVIGGVLDVKIYKYLPPPTKIKDWKMKYNYLIKDSLQLEYFSALEFQRGQQDVQFSFTLDKKIFIQPEDKVDVGIFTNGAWTTDNITDVKFDYDTK